jgi:hypothetical protein
LRLAGSACRFATVTTALEVIVPLLAALGLGYGGVRAVRERRRLARASWRVRVRPRREGDVSVLLEKYGQHAVHVATVPSGEEDFEGRLLEAESEARSRAAMLNSIDDGGAG